MKSTTNVAISTDIFRIVAMQVGEENVEQAIETAVIQSFPHEASLDAAYAEMAADEEREADALELIEGVIGDVAEDK